MRRHSSRAIQQPKNVHAEGTRARHAHRSYRRREHKLVSRSGATGGREKKRTGSLQQDLCLIGHQRPNHEESSGGPPCHPD
ncbi:hypothetical protein NDU88_001484 [Pleurodeles waltl]|uniref:Uncharacterized protein n=1 Tax=Pleurodeles waltl TaxID=8319 RepID=A0AAV7USY0_PLEWA|nr:hypothetical protein NDU88_001484 [Pleurodeles waltl]